VSHHDVRLAEHADIEAIVALVESAYRGDASRVGWSSEADLLDGQRIDAGMLTAALDSPDVRILVLQQAGTIVACCELTRSEVPGLAKLGMFAVDPTSQNGGLGRRVLAEGERFVAETWRSDTLQITVIDVRQELIAWYERRGYGGTGEVQAFPYGDLHFGIPRRDDLQFAVLEKRLSPAGD